MKNLDDISIFAKVVEAKSFTKGAKLLGMPKPSVSRRVANLEESLGVRLLQRTTRRLELTEAGRILFETAIPGLEIMERSIQLTSETQAEPSGLLRISSPVAFAASFLSGAIADFNLVYPKMKIELMATDQYLDLIESGVDLAFRTGSLSDSTLIARKLGSTARLVVASPEYLERNGSPQKPKDLKDHQCLVYGSPTDQITWHFKNKGVSHKIQPGGSLFSNSMDVLLRWSLAGAGISMQPGGLVSEHIESGRLVEVLTDYTLPLAEIAAIYPSRHQLSVNVRVFLDFIVPRSESWTS